MTSHFALLSIDAKNRNANNISEKPSEILLVLPATAERGMSGLGSFGSMLPNVPILRLPGLHGENR